MKRQRPTTNVTTYVAECHGCDWVSTAANALGNAARHHDATFHHITIRVVRDVTYGQPGPAIPGRLELEEELAKL